MARNTNRIHDWRKLKWPFCVTFLYVLLGVRTVYAPLMSVPARETLCAHGIEAIADAVVPAIRNRTDTGFCPMESAVWDISDPHEAKAALERKISEMMAKK